MNLKPIFVFRIPLFCCILLLASACQKELVVEDVEPAPTPNLEILNPVTGECNEEGVRYHFTLTVSGPGFPSVRQIPQGMTYLAFHDPTFPFSLARDCVCNLEEYIFEFDDLPGPQDILVQHINGHPVPFTGPFPIANSSGEYIVVPRSYLTRSVVIGFNSSVEPLPRLFAAGGFCVVDNISGPREEAEMTEIYSKTFYSAPQQLWIEDLYLPLTSMDYLVP